MPTVHFPAHTQARMDATNASKKASHKPVALPKRAPHNDKSKSLLQGLVVDLSIDSRRAILECPTRVTIAYGTVEKPLALVENVNLAMLRHYIPTIVDKFQKTTRGFGTTIMLPDEMELVTERGLKYVINNMLKEIREGSYYEFSMKDNMDMVGYTIRPRDNPVDMIHALNTLRAFGMEKDATFLSMEDGPIAVGLVKKVRHWDKSLKGLQRYLLTLDRVLLMEQDRHVLNSARVVYDVRLREAPAKSHKD
ncbi:hypothetical protein VMCG_04905 [Cytospora schulzeri]|uniref:Uncharacterized protein n=1 Tax=Cytospora schulzeri TaxID=448051 RepID=A0A423WNV2_9PEZI|nr:hypothetical protein VMCG_04905 [Valsa malicola]